MRKFIVLLMLSYTTSTALSQIPTHAKYAYTLPEMVANDSVFITSLYSVLFESSESERQLFDDLEYFNMKMSKIAEGRFEVVVEANRNPTIHAPEGYVTYHNKFFMLNGTCFNKFFGTKKEDRLFHGEIPVDFDDQTLLWLLHYDNEEWVLVEYPDKY